MISARGRGRSKEPVLLGGRPGKRQEVASQTPPRLFHGGKSPYVQAKRMVSKPAPIPSGECAHVATHRAAWPMSRAYCIAGVIHRAM